MHLKQIKTIKAIGAMFIKSRYCFSGTTRLLSDSDPISQSDIDMILGIDHSEVELQDNKPTSIVTGQLFYGLVPTKNNNFPECIDPNQEYILDTPNQNIMQSLGLTVDSSFEDYCQGLNQFWKQDQLYGQVSQKNVILPQQLHFQELLTHNSKYLQRLRDKFVVNLSMPGSIQAQDPRNFMELRPVEQFRNTPIIPIEESTMRRHKQKLQQYHRRQFIFEVSKESIVNFSLFAVAASICAYMIYTILQKEQQRTVAYTRFKFNRRWGSQEAPTFRI